MTDRGRGAGRRGTGWNERDDSFAPPPRPPVEAATGAGVEAGTGAGGETPRFVVHLPVVTSDLARALNLACALARSLSFMTEIDTAETTVTEETDQRVPHRVFCDRLLPDRTRCAGRAGHPGRCAPY